ncbi:MAG: Nramp family divalent metal transporter [Sphingobacteriaceae bacterium]
MSENSLDQVHRSVKIPSGKNPWKKLFAFVGPAYLVSVGYMDPGNWATDIAGGSVFGYQLIWVLLLSNLMALLLQSLSARLGIVRGLDLAQASRASYPAIINIPLYILAEIAIAACDLAEIIGMAIGLQLLFGMPLIVGISISVLDTILLLFLMNRGIKLLERFIISLVVIIGISFLLEMFIVQPDFVAIGKGFIPSALSADALYIAIGIIGATVMPHNLYLHSSLVQTRSIKKTFSGMKDAIKYNFIDSTIALNLAFFVNAAILILAAAAFHQNGYQQVAEIQDAHRLLSHIFGNLAPTLFAIALICAGQSSTVTGTLAGQIIMEGYLNLRIRPWLRRLITRLLAVVPAMFTIYYFGEASLGKLLIFSQVVLSLQLGFAIIPLIHFTSDKKEMKEFVIGWKVKLLAWLAAIIVVSLNVKLVINQLNSWLALTPDNLNSIEIVVILILLIAALLLIYIFLAPFFNIQLSKNLIPHGIAENFSLQIPAKPKRIAVAIGFSAVDKQTITAAIQQGGTEATYLLIHSIETVNANYAGQASDDHESRADRSNLEKYQQDLIAQGYQVEIALGYGNPAKAIAQIVNQSEIDLLVLGAHGHKGIKDIIFGTTLDSLRHRVKVPVLIIR